MTTAPEAPDSPEAVAPVRRLPQPEWAAWAPFVYRCNRHADGGVRCVHSEQGADPHSHARELAALPPEGAAFWALGTPRHPLGWAGCTFDTAQQRGWLRGPLVAADAPVDAGRQLLAAAQGAPGSLQRLDAFTREGDEPLEQLYRDAGFDRVDVHRVMVAPLQDRPLDALPPPPPAPMSRQAAMRALHERLFPGAYLSAQDLLDAAADPRRFLLLADNGYVVATDEPDMDEVYVDFLGVAEAARGQGLGRQLLEAAMRWGRQRGRRQAALTVRQDRLAAMTLYARCGFAQAFAGIQWCKLTGTAPGA